MDVFIVILCWLAALFSFSAFACADWITGKFTEFEKKYRQDQASIHKILLNINELERLNNQDQKAFLALASEVLERSMNK